MPIDLFDLIVNVAAAPEPTTCDTRCDLKIGGLLEVPVIVQRVVALWLTLIVASSVPAEQHRRRHRPRWCKPRESELASGLQPESDAGCGRRGCRRRCCGRRRSWCRRLRRHRQPAALESDPDLLCRPVSRPASGLGVGVASDDWRRRLESHPKPGHQL